MPSDPTGTHPQGVLTRPAPDFFDDQLSCGAAYLTIASTPTNTWFSVSLFNNALQGLLFKVYAITVVSNGGAGVACFFVKGSVGTFQHTCVSPRADVGTLYGQVYSQLVTGSAAAANPFITSPPIAILDTGGFDCKTHIFPFPAFILPVGYSLVLANQASVLNNGGGGFWFQQANE